MKKRKFADGGDVLEEANKGENLDTTPGPKAESEAPKSKTFSQAFAEARRSGDKTFMWNGKKYGTEMAGTKPAKTSASAPTPAPMAESKKDSHVPDARARLAARFGTAEQRAKYSPDQMIPQADIDAAKAAGAARRKRQDEGGPFAAAKETMRNIMESGRKSRERLSGAEMAKGGAVKKYAKGGSVSSRADGCAQRGKTKGKMV